MLAPAQWMSALVRSATAGRVDLAETRGSFWSGEGTLVLASGGGTPGSLRASLPERLTWKLSPVALLTGSIDLTLAHPSALVQPLHIRAAFNGRIDAGPSTVRLPASLLIGLGAPWNTVRPGGVVSVTWDRLAIERRRFQGNVTAEWQFASSNLTPVSPFGHYRLLTNGVFPGTQLNLLTLSGPLELTGNGTIAEGGRLRFQGVARALPGTDPAIKTQLTGLISLLGRRDGESAILNFGS
ncbi:MAG TPA: type II secretion system protein N [Burkholderiaceae bacterium]|nr:type II secretion system protein N [Burkholderiaceae bacterium]